MSAQIERKVARGAEERGVGAACTEATRPADLVQGDAKLRGNSGDADATENHENGSER